MKKDEIQIIEDLKKKFLFPQSEGIGIGDDSAVVSFKNKALLTTDLMIEGVHFDLSYTSFYHLGFKIVSVNVSDIYAMGGEFKAFLLSLGMPQFTSDENLSELYEGVEDALEYYGGFLIGGDISRSEKFILSGFAVGESEKPVLRKGAESGDVIFISYPTGLSAAALNFLRTLSEVEREEIRKVRDFKEFDRYSNKFGEKFSEILERHLMPKARNPKKFKKLAKAMMDISDGLLIDLYRLCEESGVGAEIFVEKLPIYSPVQRIAKYLGMDFYDFILAGGEDYELLVIAEKEVESFIGLIPIGRIVDQKGIYLIDPSKGRIQAKPSGWQHF